MINLLIDFIHFLNSVIPLLFSVAVFTLLAILLSKSIKKHAKIYYIVFSLPFILVIVPFIFRLCGVQLFNLSGIRFLGTILRDYIHMGSLGFPILIIIMYMGALDIKNPMVKKLMNIRKELSIIVGFPVLTHTIIRIFNNFPSGWQYFTNHTGYLEKTTVTNELGAGLTNFAYVLGAVMTVIFLVLWITSFDSVHKKLGRKKWKKIQKWSYVLYACLFIHAMGLQLGFLLNPRQRNTPKPVIEATANADTRNKGENVLQREINRTQDRQGQNSASSTQPDPKKQQSEVKAPERNKRPQSKNFSDIEVSNQTKRYINIGTLLLIFGSYLYLRIRKAKTDKKNSLIPL